jgi:transposase InsO family protein
MALITRRPEPGPIHHSDRGVQYASREYVARLEEAGALISMAAMGNPYERTPKPRTFPEPEDGGGLHKGLQRL